MKKIYNLFMAAAVALAASGTAIAAEPTELSVKLTPDNPFFAPNGWDNPSTNYTVTEENGVITIDLKDATNERWQAQFPYDTDITPSGDLYYAISFDIESTTNFGAYYKIFPKTEDTNIICEENMGLTAGTPKHIFGSGKGFTSTNPIRLLFDFGGNPAESKITIKNVKFYSSTEEILSEPGTTPVEVKAELIEPTLTVEAPYYAPNWAVSSNYTETYDNGVLTIDMQDATFADWQAQFGLLTDIITVPDAFYGVGFDIVSTTDTPRAYFKLFPNTEDSNVVCDNNGTLTANESVRIFKSGAGFNTENALKLLFDFGGNAANTKVTVSNLKFYKADGKMLTEPKLGDNSGVSGIQTSSKAVYYTIDGVRVENPAKGLYIRIQNGKAVKVVK